jgi:hypothetical protein
MNFLNQYHKKATLKKDSLHYWLDNTNIHQSYKRERIVNQFNNNVSVISLKDILF